MSSQSLSEKVLTVKHTPGPWTLETVKTSVGLCHKIGTFPSQGTRPSTYACVYEDGMGLWRVFDNGTLDTELLANARLIAAAPDLLDGCKCVASWLESFNIPRTSRQNEKDEALVLLSTAIAKAEGGQ